MLTNCTVKALVSGMGAQQTLFAKSLPQETPSAEEVISRKDASVFAKLRRFWSETQIIPIARSSKGCGMILGTHWRVTNGYCAT